MSVWVSPRLQPLLGVLIAGLVGCTGAQEDHRDSETETALSANDDAAIDDDTASPPDIGDPIDVEIDSVAFSDGDGVWDDEQSAHEVVEPDTPVPEVDALDSDADAFPLDAPDAKVLADAGTDAGTAASDVSLSGDYLGDLELPAPPDGDDTLAADTGGGVEDVGSGRSDAVVDGFGSPRSDASGALSDAGTAVDALQTDGWEGSDANEGDAAASVDGLGVGSELPADAEVAAGTETDSGAKSATDSDTYSDAASDGGWDGQADAVPDAGLAGGSDVSDSSDEDSTSTVWDVTDGEEDAPLAAEVGEGADAAEADAGDAGDAEPSDTTPDAADGDVSLGPTDCVTSSTCTPGTSCIAGVCAEPAPCATDLDCPVEQHACDFLSGSCWACLAHADCEPELHCGKDAEFGVCVPDVCTPGHGQCVEGQLTTCDATGAAWDVTACADDSVCVASPPTAACTPKLCEPGPQCFGNQLVTCAEDAQSFVDQTDCLTQSKLCFGGACESLTCLPDTTFCRCGVPHACDATGSTATALGACTAAEHCHNGACVPNVCAPGEQSCVAGAAGVCNPEGSGLLSSTAVQCGDSLCASGLCGGLSCTLPAVPSGAQRLTTLSFSSSSTAGCDLNGDAKPDNRLSYYAGLASTAIWQPEFDSATWNFLLQAPDWKKDGSAFVLHSLLAQESTAGCTANAPSTCSYQPLSWSYANPTSGTTCETRLQMTAKITGSSLLEASGQMWLPVPMERHTLIPATITKLTATVSGTNLWTNSTGGKICGHVRVADLHTALDGVSATIIFGASADQHPPDIDSDGDGTNDAYSFYATWASSAVITGGTAVLAEPAVMCAAESLSCGPLPDGNRCGTCPDESFCDSYTRACKSAPQPATLKVGKSCGSCDVPGSRAYDTSEACAKDWCLSGMCADGYCAKPCEYGPDHDTEHSATGLAAADGAVDACMDSGCEPYGEQLLCMETGSVGGSAPRCLPGGSLQACARDADCSGGEVCGVRTIWGQKRTVCVQANEGEAGQTLAAAGDYCEGYGTAVAAVCANNLCRLQQCVTFCAEDADCLPGYECGEAALFASDKTLFHVCQPPDCTLDSDCPAGQFCKNVFAARDSEWAEMHPNDPLPDDPNEHLGKCFAIREGSVAVGAHCGAYDDFGLTTCRTDGGCINWTCGNRCEEDTDCPTGMACGLSIQDTWGWFERSHARHCVRAGRDADACVSDKDCAQGQVCGATVHLKNGVEVVKTACVTPDSWATETSDDCFDFFNISTLTSRCQTNLCLKVGPLGTNDTCSTPCGKRSDCPAAWTVGGKSTALACTSQVISDQGTPDTRDDAYQALCTPVLRGDFAPPHTFEDCSSTFSCPGTAECQGFLIAGNPDEPSKVEYLCISYDFFTSYSSPGGSCTSANACKSGLCLRKGNGRVCSKLCHTDADCPTSSGLYCDVGNKVVDREDPDLVATMPVCAPKQPCTACQKDSDCYFGMRCHGADIQKGTGVCVPTCNSTADCAATAPGAVCVPRLDQGIGHADSVCELGCSCGNGKCEQREAAAGNCPVDCPPSTAMCGNGACEASEATTCPCDCTDWDAPHVCDAACGSASPIQTGCATCYCDKACTIYGDCCDHAGRATLQTCEGSACSACQ